MPDRHGFCQNKPLFIGQCFQLIQFTAVEGNGLFGKHMFAVKQRLPDKFIVGVVRCRDVDNVNGWVRVHFIIGGINLFDMIFLSERYGFVVSSVADTVQCTAHMVKGLCHFIGNHAGSKYGPFQFVHCWKLLCLYLTKASTVRKRRCLYVFRAYYTFFLS